MPVTMDPFLRAYTGGDSTSDSNSMNVHRKRNPIDELDDASVSSGRRTSSASDRKSSLGSDSLWGDARRLSEAGVRRTSDSSVVLTEDTDSFIIGERVWVGGNKPGTIAYIGDTQFAPGEWAGVVLDQPIGKNDGSVANIRYFQCEPKKGIFSRLTRLTRTPLLETADVSMTGNGNLSYAQSPTSPPRPPSAASGRELKIGDRVIVMSSTGSKTGMLRYMGKTEFAPGEWCGVECDDPIGKNDGSVQGNRYFTCQAMHGLFAPVSKVSLSPSPNRRPSCAMHAPGLARQNTKDSISSTTSSKVSSVTRKPSRPTSASKSNSVTNSTEVENIKSVNKAAVAILKDKEIYIEQLLKERDLERMAVTRAASQAEEAERQLDMLKQELRQVQEVSEATQADLLHQVAELTREKRDLTNQLEDDHNKLDDLTFRFEEENMAKVEVEATSKVLEERIIQLEKLMEESKAEQLELESTRLFESEESQAKLRALLEDREADLKLAKESTGSQVQQLNAKLDKLTMENEKLNNLYIEEQKQNTNLKNIYEEVKKLRKQDQVELQECIEIKDKLELELKNLSKKLSESEVTIKDSDSLCLRLKSDLEQVRTQLSKEKDLFSEEIKLLSEKCQNLNDENNKKMSEISVLNLSVAQLQDKLKNKEDEFVKVMEENNKEISSLKGEIVDLKNTIQTKTVSLEGKEEIYKMEVNNLKQKLQEATKESEDKDEKILFAAGESSKQISDLQNIIKEKEKESEFLKIDYEKKLEELQNLQSESLNISKQTNEKVSVENDELKKELGNMKINLKTNEERLQEVLNLSEHQKRMIAGRDEEINNLKNTNEDASKALAQLTLDLGDWKRNYEGLEDKCRQLTEHKSKLENDLSELINSSSDSSQQLCKLNDNLRAKEKECCTLQENIMEIRSQAESNLQKLHQDLHATQEKAKTDVEFMQKKFNEDIELKRKEYESLTLKLIETNKVMEQLKHNLEELSGTEKDTKIKLSEVEVSRDGLEEKLKKEMDIVSKLNVELEQSRKGAGVVENTLRENVTLLERTRDSLLAEIKEYKNKEENSNIEVEERKKKEEIMKENINTLNTEKNNLILKFEEKISVLSSNLESLKSEKEKYGNVINEKDIEIVKLQQRNEILNTESQKHVDEIKLCQLKMNQMTDELREANLSALNSTCKTEELEGKLQQQLNLLNAAKNRLEETLDQKDITIKGLHNELESLKQKVNEATTTTQEREVLLSSLNQSLEEKCLDKDKMLEAVKISVSQAEEKIISLANELSSNKTNHKMDYERLKADKESLEVRFRESEEKRKQLAKSFSEDTLLKEELESKEKEVKLLQETVHSLKEKCQEINELKNKLICIEGENTRFKEDFDKQKEVTLHVDNLIKQLKNMEELQKNTELQLIKEKETSKSIHQIQERKDSLENKVEELLKENKELKNKMKNETELSKNIPIEATNNNTTTDIDQQMHIEFLNSIIADLQKKVEQQTDVIQQLQNGALSGSTRTRVITPRMFCDICDMFDLHDTDDCPRQAMDSPPPQQAHQPVPRGYQRPYCESCEMFGHDTADCDTETF